MSAGTRYSASHPILAIRSCFNLEGYSVGVVLRFVGFGPPHTIDFIEKFGVSADLPTNYPRWREARESQSYVLWL